MPDIRHGMSDPDFENAAPHLSAVPRSRTQNPPSAHRPKRFLKAEHSVPFRMCFDADITHDRSTIVNQCIVDHLIDPHMLRQCCFLVYSLPLLFQAASFADVLWLLYLLHFLYFCLLRLQLLLYFHLLFFCLCYICRFVSLCNPASIRCVAALTLRYDQLLPGYPNHLTIRPDKLLTIHLYQLVVPQSCLSIFPFA